MDLDNKSRQEAPEAITATGSCVLGHAPLWWLITPTGSAYNTIKLNIYSYKTTI